MELDSTTQVFCERSWRMGTIDTFIVVTNSDGSKSVAAPMDLQPLPENEVAAGPSMRLRMTTAQQFMDELWKCGIRPTEGTGSAGSLAATERHLKDMQAVAMGLLRKDGVELKS